jgi:hypothetical protein
MSFDTAKYLSRATGRAKSDVANKMVSMFLHAISQRIVAKTGMRVTDPAYIKTVAETFGDKCAYCRRSLELNGAAIEHLDGMNRFRAGLHIPGNVTVACVTCNREKRRDDQRKDLVLAESGWESFLSHDGKKCGGNCKTCHYWATVWPEPEIRREMLAQSRARILAFRGQYATCLHWSAQAHLHLRENLETLYRDCQAFAVKRIETLADDSFKQLLPVPTASGQPR